jgi:uncharacterized protein (DUF433 family)
MKNDHDLYRVCRKLRDCGTALFRLECGHGLFGDYYIGAGKTQRKPCVRGLRITVYDVLEQLASGMSHEEICQAFPFLTEQDIRADLGFAADRERRVEIISA